MLQRMKKMVKDQDICVLATVSGTRPHCSLMTYVTDEDCREIYMVSLRDTKKFRNLAQNPAVSLLIDTREEDAGPRRSQAKALTVNGIFQGVEGGKQEWVRSRILERHPHLKGLIGQERAEIFSVPHHRVRSQQSTMRNGSPMLDVETLWYFFIRLKDRGPGGGIPGPLSSICVILSPLYFLAQALNRKYLKFPAQNTKS